MENIFDDKNNSELIKKDCGFWLKLLLNSDKEEISFQTLMELSHLTSKANGFRLGDYIKQLLFIGTEIQEALELLCIDIKNTDNELVNMVASFTKLMFDIEEKRRQKELKENSYLLPENRKAFIEEIFDIIIRCFGILGELDADITILVEKMLYNTQRPYLHGKKN